MPTGKNWFHFLFIHFVFIIGICFLVILSFVKSIKANWPQYRCNPIYMPLSDNVELDFTYCVQTMQKQMMGNFLQPFSWILSNMSEMTGEFTDSINNARNMFGNVRTFSTDIFQNIFGVFMNLVIEIQKLIMGIKDLMQKIIGTMATIVYLIDGVMKTMKSTWNGPVGQLTRGVGNMASGSCFHPNTQIALEDGTRVAMKDLQPGDTLEKGARVISVVHINNNHHCTGEKMYHLPGDILVTGSHFVWDPASHQFLRVDKVRRAQEIPTCDIPYSFRCLITSDHRIRIGDELFWDWEDAVLRSGAQPGPDPR